MQIGINRKEAHEATRRAGVMALAQAKPGSDIGRADAAVALLALWVTARDEADFINMAGMALSITEEDTDAIAQFAKDGEFDQAARWLLG